MNKLTSKPVNKLKKEIELKDEIIKKEKKRNVIILICTTIIIIFLFLVLITYFDKNRNMTGQINNLKNINSEYEKKNNAFKPLYLFLGDSLTEQYDIFKAFPDRRIINSGYGGDQTKDILENLYRRIYRFSPTDIFLQIGTNDINYNRDPIIVYEDIIKIIQEIEKELPNAKIYVESLYPSREEWAEEDRNEKRQEVNKLLREYCKKEKLTYIDIYSLLKEDNSNNVQEKYVKDGLHLNDEGYKIITKELKKYME